MVTNTFYHTDNLFEWTWAMEDEVIPKPFFTSCYYLDGILIDTSAPGGIVEFKRFIETLLKDKQINFCLITHTYEDHIGGTYFLTEELSIPVHASDKAIELLKNASNYTYEEYRKVYWGNGLQSSNALPFPDQILSTSGNYLLDIIPTPGHAPDQVAFLEKSQRWVFVADAVLPKYNNLFGGSCNIQENIVDIYASIERLHKEIDGMDDLQVFISRKGIRHGRGFLMEKMNEIKELRSIVRDYSQEGLSSNEILIQIYGGESSTGIMTNGELSRINLINSLLEWKI
ncbi:MAG: MBL fold metallo-hydrolase [Candidatus Hodarchaeales archaeon]|jgi:glyoxylase-like metal-dependent hydrolase (beta-lactamase superfamily II)